jgi:hypothetical protein
MMENTFVVSLGKNQGGIIFKHIDWSNGWIEYLRAGRAEKKTNKKFIFCCVLFMFS